MDKKKLSPLDDGFGPFAKDVAHLFQDKTGKELEDMIEACLTVVTVGLVSSVINEFGREMSAMNPIIDAIKNGSPVPDNALEIIKRYEAVITEAAELVVLTQMTLGSVLASEENVLDQFLKNTQPVGKC